jgi:hypothetical protein
LPDDSDKNELRKAGLGSPEEYRKRLIEQYRKQQLQQKAFAELRKQAKPVNVTDEEVTAAFERSRGELQKRPATVTFRQIVVAPHASAAAKAKAKAKADSLLAEIRRAATPSRLPSASRWIRAPQLGGDLDGIAAAVDWFRNSRR